MEKYKYTDLSGSVTLEVSPNSYVEDNDVFIEVTHGRGECGYINVSGVDNILNLIYALAVHGGLSEEGEELTLEPSRVLPEDGSYLLATTDKKAIVVVEDGKLFIPQVAGPNLTPTGYMVDATETYMSPKSPWTLTELMKG